jgi:cation diffusion facilitator CzcD-associated flavoprotein CzcO
MDHLNNIAAVSLDTHKLRKKYLEERDRRLRSDGNAQYIDMAGKFEDLVHDPHVEPGFARDPVVEEIDVAIFGGGFAGLLTAAALKRLGIENLRIIEQGGDFGGTWYWNRYPGVRCDIESYIYMPLLEEVGTVPTEKYASGGEIFAHCRRLGERFGFYDRTLFQTSVTGARWDEQLSRWIVTTTRNDEIRARFVVAANGSMHRPKLPGIPGLDSFKGKSFHTSRWDYQYTGGDANGNLTGLRDKRVALIGSGATAIQIVPLLGEWAKQLHVFQRTPSAVDVRNNRLTDPQWFKAQPAGWQRERMSNFLRVTMGVPVEDMVQDRWSEVWSQLNAPPPSDMDAETASQLRDYEVMEYIRKRVDQIVENPKTADALKPWYRYLCKRPLYSDNFLDTFNRPNVTLVDTQGKGVERITETAIVHEGETYEIDCLVFATGFRVGTYCFDGGGYEITGKDGQTLREKWSSGVRSLHGIHTRGFPNFFIVGGYAQASAGNNYLNCAMPQAEYVAAAIHRGTTSGAKAMEVSKAAEDRWAQAMIDKNVDRSKIEAECTPGYYTSEGSGPSLWSNFYGGGPMEYIAICKEWCVNGVEADMDLTF